MLGKIAKPEEAYDQLYSGKTLVVKAGGAELAQWKQKHAEPRKKLGGVGVTTEKVLNDAVLPAYEEIRGQLIAALESSIEIVSPDSVVCERDSEFGLVGNATEIKGIMPTQDSPLKAVGFVGRERDTDQPLNINADSIVHSLVSQHRDAINGAILLTGTGAILDNTGARVPLILSGDIQNILGGTHPKVKVDGGMAKKLLEVKKMLPDVGKVAITNAAGLIDEIEKWQGSGTLCVDETQISCGPLLPIEEEIFRAVHEEMTQQGYFRPRSPEELAEAMAHHHVVRIKNSPIGGFSLVPNADGWHELCSMWAEPKGNGLSGTVLRAAINAAGSEKVFALTQSVPHVFEKAGFKGHGKVRELSAAKPGDLPDSVMHYQHEGRNPQVFTWSL
ncbi:hypothetical protein HZA42_04615 [Candidatus Peregrinibacteria bacterium]|nr:hypothetical protein [Candidatus Peregrinibacteria bacterium]